MSLDPSVSPVQWATGKLEVAYAESPLSDDFSNFPLVTTAFPGEDSNDSTIYRQFRRVTEHYSSIHGYTASIICLWGIPANMATIVVLTRPKMVQSSTNQLLIWLAVSDLMTMASFLPLAINFYVLRNPDWLFPSTKSWAWISYLIFAINSVVTWHTIAIWLTISLAIFRFLFICYPTRGQEMCSRARANLAVGLVFFCCTLLCVPNYFLTEVYSVPLPSYESTDAYDRYDSFVPGTPGIGARPPDDSSVDQNPDELTYVTSTEKTENSYQGSDIIPYYYSVRDAESSALLSHINFWIQALLFKLIPCILLTALTCFLISAMREARRRRCKLKSQGRRDESDRAAEHQRTTAMLLAIVGLFLVTEFPQGLLTLLSIFLPNFHQDYYQPLGDILDIAALLNNSINFVLYCAMSRQFRETFTGVFFNSNESCCRCYPNDDVSTTNSRSYSLLFCVRSEAKESTEKPKVGKAKRECCKNKEIERML